MRRLFPLLILVFAVSSLLIYLFGDSGVLSYDDLASYRAKLADNVESLDARHAELDARLTRLRDDPSAAIVMARDLGLYPPGEAVIKLGGVPSRPEINAIGDLLRYRKPPDTRSTAFKAAAVALSFVLLAWVILQRLAAKRRAHARPGR